MEKLVYMVWKRSDLSDEAFTKEMLGPTAKKLLALGVHKLAMNLVNEHVAHTKNVRLTKLDPPMSGMVAFWMDLTDDRESHEEVLAAVTDRRAGYLVVESVPVVNTTHTAPLGERTPGINVIACIEKPDHLTRDAWIEHWHVHHRKVAVETQCVFSYVRNVVVRPLTADAPPWDGIVEEAFPAEAVTDPMIWYCADGSEEKLRRNMARMMESVVTFLDVNRVESNPMTEYKIKD